jgi:hypothetical protein
VATGDGAMGRRIAARLMRPAAVLLLYALFSMFLIGGVAGSSSRIAQSYHGLHHAAYVYQLTEGIVPPTNPSSIDAPANFYWAYHGLLAGLVVIFDITSFEASIALNVASLTLFLFAFWWAAGRYTNNLLLRIGFSVLPFFLLNPFGFTLYFADFVSSVFAALGAGSIPASDQGGFMHWLQADSPLRAALPDIDALLPMHRFAGVPLISRSGLLAVKFFNASSFPAAIALYVLGTAVLTISRTSRFTLTLLVMLGLLIALFSPYPAMALAVTAGASVLSRVSLSGIGKRRSAEGRDGLGWPLARRELVELVAPLLAVALGIALALPHILAIGAAFGSNTAIVWHPAQLLSRCVEFGWSIAPMLPFFAWAVIRWPSLSVPSRTHLISGLSLCVLTIVISAPVNDPNEYKLALLASVPTSLLILGLLVETGPKVGSQKRATAIGLSLLTVGAGSLALCVLPYASSQWATASPYVYTGRDIDLSVPPGHRKRANRQAAYRWLRDETPAEAFVLQEPVGMDDLELSVIAQRRVVAGRHSYFTLQIPHHPALVQEVRRVVHGLSVCDAQRTDLAALQAIPVAWPDEIYGFVAVDAQARLSPGGCAGALPLGVTLAYANAAYEIYRIQLDTISHEASPPESH